MTRPCPSPWWSRPRRRWRRRRQWPWRCPRRTGMSPWGPTLRGRVAPRAAQSPRAVVLAMVWRHHRLVPLNTWARISRVRPPRIHHHHRRRRLHAQLWRGVSPCKCLCFQWGVLYFRKLVRVALFFLFMFCCIYIFCYGLKNKLINADNMTANFIARLIQVIFVMPVHVNENNHFTNKATAH